MTYPLFFDWLCAHESLRVIPSELSPRFTFLYPDSSMNQLIYKLLEKYERLSCRSRSWSSTQETATIYTLLQFA
ncbi:hypothetical protein HI914_02968 [Erysiphe necator]|nr:hypothetical protein HI914_02968 [Erysiphe necator]